MSQDLNPNPSACSSLVIFTYWACERHGNMYFLCCDQKAQAASAQSFTLLQQATIEITWRDHSIIACSRHIKIWVLLFMHILFVVNHTFNARTTERLQQHPFLFAINRTYRMFFLWRSHPVFFKPFLGVKMTP